MTVSPPASADLEHPIERDLGPALRIVGDDDLVVDVTLEQALEDPEQVVRRHAEHRRAEATEWIERHDRALGGDLLGEPVDEVNLGRDRPDGTNRTALYRLDDVFSRAAQI